MKKKSVFVGALAAVAVGVIGQGCSSKHGSGFGENGTNNGGVGTEGGDASTGDNPPFDGGSIGDASFHTDSGLSADAGCATATASAQRQPVYMLIVLDGSGSMAHTNNGDPAQKWSAVVPALDAFFDDLKQHPDPGFGVGLTVFSDKNDPNCTTQFGIMTCDGTYPTMNVPIAFVDAPQADKLRRRIDPTSPVDGTPTVAVLKGQYAAMESWSPSAPLPPSGKKVVVLMTDGVPNDSNNTPTATLQQQCITMAEQEVTSKDITTFVVGVGNYAPLNTDEYDPAFLGKLAQAGGAAKAGCDPTTTSDETKMCHFQVTPGNKSAQQLEQDFLAAINAIRGKTYCTFILDKPDGGGKIDPSKINVVHDDGNGHKDTIPQDPNDGWTYDDPNNPTSVTLHGKACDDVKNQSVGSVSIVVGCATIVR